MKNLFNLASCLLLSAFFVSVTAYGSNPMNDDNVDEPKKIKMISVPYMRSGLIPKTFLRDENGYLINRNGSYVKGWPLDSSGKVLPEIDTLDPKSLKYINFSNIGESIKAPTVLEIVANFSSDNDVSPIGTQFYIDAKICNILGEDHTLTITWKRIAIDQYSASMSCPAASSINKGSATGDSYTNTPMVVKFNSLGQPISFDGATTPSNIYINWDPTQTNAAPSKINLKLGEINTFTGIMSRAGAFSVFKNSNDGLPRGKFKEVKIDNAGYVYTCFDNGTILPTYYAPNIQ